jgi:hypothetical protein
MRRFVQMLGVNLCVGVLKSSMSSAATAYVPEASQPPPSALNKLTVAVYRASCD